MRTLTPTLLAASTAWKGRPIAHATVRDRRLRWRTAEAHPENDDTPYVAQASSGAWMLRLKTDASGDLWLARIASGVHPGAAWHTWTRIATGVAAPNGDCAISYRAGTWYTYYIDSANRAYRLTSGDDGQSWGGATLVRSCTRAGFVAAAANWVFVQEHQVHAYESDLTSGALSGPCTQVSPTTNGGHGLAAARDADGEQVCYRLLFTVKGDIWAVTFDPDAGSYGDAHRLAPGADQDTASGADNRYPALCCAAHGLLLATWVERHDNGLSGEPASWRYPVARLCLEDETPPAGGQHFGCETPLATPSQTARRMAALFDATEQTFYLGNDRLLLAARAYSEDPLWSMRFGPQASPEYTLLQRANRPASLTLTIPDSGDDWAQIGQPGYAEAPLRPLAEITLSRGYHTAAGNETVDLPPCYITRVQRSEGQGGAWLRLQCTDALGLLALWSAPETLLWKNRTIRWLLAELCAQVGLRYRDGGEAALGRTAPLFTLLAGQTALHGTLALLRLGGCVARIAPDGALQPLPWPAEDPPAMALGSNDELRRGRFGLAVPGATAVRVTSGGAYAEGEIIADAWALGMRRVAALHDSRIGLNGDMADAVRDRELALVGLDARADEAVIPVRPDLELWDTVDLHCAATAGDGISTARVVTGIEERRSAARAAASIRRRGRLLRRPAQMQAQPQGAQRTDGQAQREQGAIARSADQKTAAKGGRGKGRPKSHV